MFVFQRNSCMKNIFFFFPKQWLKIEDGLQWYRTEPWNCIWNETVTTILEKNKCKFYFHMTTAPLVVLAVNAGLSKSSPFIPIFTHESTITWCVFCHMILISGAILQRIGGSGHFNTGYVGHWSTWHGWNVLVFYYSALMFDTSWRMDCRGMLPVALAACCIGE